MPRGGWSSRRAGGRFCRTWTACTASPAGCLTPPCNRSGRRPRPARAAIGWARVRRDGDSIRLAPGQALTLNGMAQGFATDRVRALLRDAGLDRCLVNIGEFAALGGPWRLGLADPVHGHLGQVTLDGTAVATSSPAADQVGGQAHILHATARPRWSTV